MITEYFKELRNFFQVNYRIGHADSVAACRNICTVIFLRFVILRERNHGETLFTEIYAVVFQLFIGMKSYQPLNIEKRLSVRKCLNGFQLACLPERRALINGRSKVDKTAYAGKVCIV